LDPGFHSTSFGSPNLSSAKPIDWGDDFLRDHLKIRLTISKADGVVFYEITEGRKMGSHRMNTNIRRLIKSLLFDKDFAEINQLKKEK
jgi:hypothetical protein